MLREAGFSDAARMQLSGGVVQLLVGTRAMTRRRSTASRASVSARARSTS